MKALSFYPSAPYVEYFAPCPLSVHTSLPPPHTLLSLRYYVTPKSYLDLISLYTRLLQDKRHDMALDRDRLLNGLQKLQV